MNSKVFFTFIETFWTDIRCEVKDALVYLDDPIAECLHWHYGLEKLLKFGAVNVENFTPFVKADSSVRKAVFVLSSPIIDETLRTLMLIIKSHSFKQCVIFTSLPAKFHTDESSDDITFMTLENKILSWLENEKSSIMIQHVPIFTAHLAHNLFILPSFVQQFSISACGLLEMNRKRTVDFTIKNLPAKEQTNVKQLAYCLDSILDTFRVKADVFSLGVLSHIVSNELATLSNQQKKSHTRKVSVIIVDRLLDLAGPLSQTYETMLDQVLRAFPHLPGHVFDVSIPMNDLSPCKNESVFGRPLLARGCLAHKNTAEELTAYYAILEKHPREALIEVNRQIVESATNEGLQVDLNLRLTPDTLRKRILAFKDKPDLMNKYSGLLQLCLGVVQALEYATKNPVDKLSATEEALIQYLTSSSEEVFSNIMQMISEREEVNYKMEEILIFVAFIYMLSGCSSIGNESTLQATLMETLFQEDFSELLSMFVEGDLDDDNILTAVRTYIDVLKRLGTIRKGLKKYNTVFKSTNPAFPASYNPLLKQLLDDILDSTVNDIPDLEFHSGSLKDYIKTGISLFMNVAKPQPRDNLDVFLVILGGLTPSEIKYIRDKEAHYKDRQIYVCCTQVITPSDVLKDLGAIVKELSADISSDEDESDD